MHEKYELCKIKNNYQQRGLASFSYEEEALVVPSFPPSSRIDAVHLNSLHLCYHYHHHVYHLPEIKPISTEWNYVEGFHSFYVFYLVWNRRTSDEE